LDGCDLLLLESHVTVSDRLSHPQTCKHDIREEKIQYITVIAHELKKNDGHE